LFIRVYLFLHRYIYTNGEYDRLEDQYYIQRGQQRTNTSILKGREPFIYTIIATCRIPAGETTVTRKTAVGSPRLLDAAAAIAWHEDGEATLRVPIDLHIGRLRLKPTDGPVGVVRV